MPVHATANPTWGTQQDRRHDLIITLYLPRKASVQVAVSVDVRPPRGWALPQPCPRRARSCGTQRSIAVVRAAAPQRPVHTAPQFSLQNVQTYTIPKLTLQRCRCRLVSSRMGPWDLISMLAR